MSAAVMSSPNLPDSALHKRKRSLSPDEDLPPSSRRRSHSPPQKARLDLPKVIDVDPIRRAERERQLAARVAAMELEKTDKPKDSQSDAQAEFAKLVGSRSGGVYMPPARLRALQAAASSDKASAEYQRLSWDALRKSITGIVNRVNIVNIKAVVPELFAENLIRGRGLFCRSVMKAQASSLTYTPVFAALVAIINTKLPQVGELILARLISQFRRAFKRNDKIVCHSTTTFIGHLVNQSVAHEIIALQIIVLLIERPTDDSIEIAVGFMREVGAFLAENSPKANATVFERFRAVLNEGSISQRVQYMIEVLMQVRKDKYKDNPILPEGLDLVEEEEQITHQIQLEEELQVQEGLNIFKFDPNYLENEEKYKSIKTEILGEDSDEESGSEESSEDEDEDEVAAKEGIEDRTETNLVNLRRTIYLSIMNALNYEEAVHKLLKVQLQEGQEIELVNMIIECCSQERSYSTFYGLVGERFSKLNRVWTDCFEQAFGNYYTTIHRYETNRLRNIARFFGHLLASDAISWLVLECVKINEDDTTSSSRIFVKIMMTEMTESMGLKTVAERFKDPEVRRGCEGMFPVDVPKNTRFAINYFTSIGLGVVTEEMREYLKNAPRLIMEQRRAMLDAESSDSSSSDSDSDSDSSSSDSSSSVSRGGARRRSPSRTPPRRRTGADSLSPRRRDDSPPPPPRRREMSPPVRRGARRDSTPPRRGRQDSRSVSPPPLRRDSPPRRRISRSPPPPPRRRDSRSPPPPPRRRDSRSPPPPPRRRASRSPPPPPRRRDSRSPPPREKDASVRRRFDSPPRRATGNGNGRERERPPHVISPRARRDRSRSGERRPLRGDSQERERSPPPLPRERRRDSRERERRR
ncbi:MIF4G-domain-containing protein [Mycena leptocephala]|nr:MIF4G-domain-containing protein [Mycena leptocephala]